MFFITRSALSSNIMNQENIPEMKQVASIVQEQAHPILRPRPKLYLGRTIKQRSQICAKKHFNFRIQSIVRNLVQSSY
jgi:hypothetical protein